MPAFSTLHNELRARVPNKTSEFYDDALRWAVNHICIKTSLWQVVTTVTTKPLQDVYDVDLVSNSVIHSNLFIIQKGNIDRVIVRPTNGFKSSGYGNSDWLQAFKTFSNEAVQIIPTPAEGNETLEIHTAVKPSSSATGVDNDKIFNEYKDTVVYGALYRLYQAESDIEQAEYNNQKFKEGVSSIHVDVLKENANTPMLVSAAW
ncbi:MAG: hypothetical protein DRQ40_09770 [Gammaproteobacteria bacterium]|nr:MAG: hypothetical protein DRQ40_09770 [Gammaproteobacteria bacterium]